MTKDRRLGRGLAALLGTPVEEGLSTPTSGYANASNPPVEVEEASSHSRPAMSERQETIRKMTSDAQSQAASNAGSRSPITVPVSTPSVGSVSNADQDTGSINVQVSDIDPNPFQPRRHFSEAELDSLAASIREHQQLQPILVRRVGERFQLISGERRLRATVRAGLSSIRAEVRVADDRMVAEIAIIENLQRKDLNAIEKALSFKRYLTEHRATQEELAKRLKIDRSSIANLMRLLELPEVVTDAIQRDEISAGHAKALLSLGSIKEQVAFMAKVRDEGWSVRETEARVSEFVAQAAESGDDVLAAIPRRKASKPDQITSLERELKMHLGTRVDIAQTSRGRGRLTIHFTSIEEFERIRSYLSNAVSRSSQRAA